MKVIAHKNLPFRPPVIGTAVAALVLDRLDAPQLAWGVVGTIYALFWIAWIVAMFHQEQVNLFTAAPMEEALRKIREMSEEKRKH